MLPPAGCSCEDSRNRNSEAYSINECLIFWRAPIRAWIDNHYLSFIKVLVVWGVAFAMEYLLTYSLAVTYTIGYGLNNAMHFLVFLHTYGNTTTRHRQAQRWLQRCSCFYEIYSIMGGFESLRWHRVTRWRHYKPHFGFSRRFISDSQNIPYFLVNWSYESIISFKNNHNKQKPTTNCIHFMGY